jgi:peptide/nickel transport system permease protein
MILRTVLVRVVTATLTLLAVSILIFSLVELLPGDIAFRALGRDATPEAKEAFAKALRLDRPAPVRYALWLGGLIRGDLGTSLISQRPVGQIIADGMRNTLVLAAYAFVLYFPLSILLATLAAVFRERGPDHAVSVVVLALSSTPDYVIGTLLLFLGAVTLGIFPAMALIDHANNTADVLRVVALPAITLMLVLLPHQTRLLRDNLIEVLNSDYVRMAILKGLPLRRVVFRHALPNGVVPALNVTAGNLAYLIGGVVIVEQVFAFPGIGSVLINSIFLRDTPVLATVALIVSAVYIFGNFTADMIGMLFNPRLRTR